MVVMPEVLERDGFQITKRVFKDLPDTTILDPVAKRRVTICNLFSNYRLPIKGIVRILDDRYEHVVRVLIERGVICDRRTNSLTVKIDRRGSLFRTR